MTGTASVVASSASSALWTFPAVLLAAVVIAWGAEAAQFLISQGLSPDIITAKGMGQDNPVADNSTAAGRKQNRRVEIIVSGQVIGAKIGK